MLMYCNSDGHLKHLIVILNLFLLFCKNVVSIYNAVALELIPLVVRLAWFQSRKKCEMQKKLRLTMRGCLECKIS